MQQEYSNPASRNPARAATIPGKVPAPERQGSPGPATPQRGTSGGFQGGVIPGKVKI